MNSQDALMEARRQFENSELGKSVARVTVKNTGTSSGLGVSQGEAINAAWQDRMTELIRSHRWNAIKRKLAHMLETRGYDDVRWMCEQSRHSRTLLNLLSEAERGL